MTTTIIRLCYMITEWQAGYSVVDPDPDLHHFGNLDPHPDPHPDQIKIRIRIRIRVKSRIGIRIKVMRIHNTGWLG